MMRTRLYEKMRAEHIPTGDAGLWSVRRMPALDGENRGRPITVLRCMTEATMQHMGDVVMEDSARELARHMPVVLFASGRVLVTGLGLGCVVRGLLATGHVEHVDVVEKSAEVVKLVWPSFGAEEALGRVTLHEGDAATIEWPEDKRWDYAWHDLWVPEGNSALQVLHTKLFVRYRGMTLFQGCWGMDRATRRVLKTHADDPDWLLTGQRPG